MSEDTEPLSNDQNEGASENSNNEFHNARRNRRIKICKGVTWTITILIVIATASGGIYGAITLSATGNGNFIETNVAPTLKCYGSHFANSSIVCPGSMLYCYCTVNGDLGYTQWGFTSMLRLCDDNIINLNQSAPDCKKYNESCSSSFYAMNVPPENNSLPCKESELRIHANSDLDGINVTCKVITPMGQQISTPFQIKIQMAPMTPTITSLMSPFPSQLTVTWTNTEYTNYSVSINKTNTTDVFLGYETHPVTWNFTGLESNTIYYVSVVARNCRGNSSTASEIGRTARCPSLRLTKPTNKIPLCPADTVQYTCSIDAAVYNETISILWTGTAFNCPQENNSITLLQASNGPVNTSEVMCGDMYAAIFDVNESCYTSILTIRNPKNFYGSIIQCLNGRTQDIVGSEELLQEFKTAPSTPKISIYTSNSAITVSWPPDPTADIYNVSIITAYFMSSISTTTSNYTYYAYSDTGNYAVSVTAINCAGSSSPGKETSSTGESAQWYTGLVLLVIGAIITVPAIILFLPYSVFCCWLMCVTTFQELKKYKCSLGTLPALTVVGILMTSTGIGLITKSRDQSPTLKDENPLLRCDLNNVNTQICPGTILYCNCTANSDTGLTQWNFASNYLCDNKNVINIRHLPPCNNVHYQCGNTFYVQNRDPGNDSVPCSESFLMINVSRSLQSFNVTCLDTKTNQTSDPFHIEIGAAPLPPTITSNSSTYSTLTITWTSINRTNYSVSMNESNMYLEYRTQLNTFTFTDLKDNTVYNVSVVAMNCMGNSSAASVIERTAACQSLKHTNPAPEMPVCPNSTVQYLCTLSHIDQNSKVIILWNGTKFNCSEENNSITVIQIPNGPVNKTEIECGAASAAMLSINETCYTSVLTIKNPMNFNGSMIQCYNGRTEDIIGGEELLQQFKAAPITPNITLNTSSSAITVRWTPDPTADSYEACINIINSTNIASNYAESFNDENTITMSVTRINYTRSSGPAIEATPLLPLKVKLNSIKSAMKIEWKPATDTDDSIVCCHVNSKSIPSYMNLCTFNNLSVMCTFNNLIVGTIYNVSVTAINCAGSSRPAVKNVTVPSNPSGKSDQGTDIALELGLGLGLGIPFIIFIVAVVIVVLICWKKGHECRKKIEELRSKKKQSYNLDPVNGNQQHH